MGLFSLYLGFSLTNYDFRVIFMCMRQTHTFQFLKELKLTY